MQVPGDPRLIADDRGPANAKKKAQPFLTFFTITAQGVSPRQLCATGIAVTCAGAALMKSLSILIGWYRDQIGNRLGVKPPQQAKSPASDVARVTQAAGSPVNMLKQAPRASVEEEIKAAYDIADAAGGKPPNIKELPAAVQPLLEQRGYGASARFIQELGNAPVFKVRRRSPGKTVSSERRARQT